MMKIPDIEVGAIMDNKIANELFTYDPVTGKLYWKIRPCRNVFVGDEIKTKRGDGYLTVMYKRKKYLVHRIIWLLTYGEFPKGQIDHADHDRTNNKLANLRDVSSSSNNRNRSIHKNNTSGFSGVGFHKKAKKWQARGVTSDGISKHLGLFDKIEDAIEARKAFNCENGYHSNHGS